MLVLTFFCVLPYVGANIERSLMVSLFVVCCLGINFITKYVLFSSHITKLSSGINAQGKGYPVRNKPVFYRVYDRCITFVNVLFVNNYKVF